VKIGLVCLALVGPAGGLFAADVPAADQAAKEYNLLAAEIGRYKPQDARQERLAREALRPDALIQPSDRDPLDVVLRRTKALLDHLRTPAGAPDLAKEAGELEALGKRAAAQAPGSAERRALFGEACELRRRIAFANPLLDFDKILFLTHHRSRYNHMCDQYYGFNARPGGGVYVLNNPFGKSPTVTNVLEKATVENGRLKGRRLEGGSFLSLELDWNAETIYFAWTEADAPSKPYAGETDGWHCTYPAGKGGPYWAPTSTFHIFKAGADGKGLVQLTDGPWNEFDPCVLPNGRIAFISERRGGFLRCSGDRPCPTYAMFAMCDDGSDLIPLSYHETHEWHPSVDNAGMIVYTRWDYVDRDSDIAHHIWLCYPDGRDPRSYHGNYPRARESRPWMELAIRAIPGSHRYAAVAAPHHGQNYGSIVLIDHRLPDDHSTGQLKRVTPEVSFPESEGSRNRSEVYGQPWPLSEDFFLCVYDPDAKHYGLYLVDSFGNKELLYQDAAVPCLDPIPLRPRPRAPILTTGTVQTAADRAAQPNAQATVSIMNVYDSEVPWPEGTRIAALRIVQIFPKTTPAIGKPNIGLGDQSVARGVVGTVPVEADGSAYFEAPVGVPIYFQALDERGIAVQTMRSDTYVHAGEHLTCQGCHEPKLRSPARTATPAAMRREPSKIVPGPEGSNPLLYPRLVQPVLDRYCVACHAKNEKAPGLQGDKFTKVGWSESFASLAPLGWAKHGGNGALPKKNLTSYSVPGQIGARASKLFTMLEKGHHDMKLPAEDLLRITLWIDCNTNFYGAYHDTEKQAAGETVLPTLE